MTFSVSTRRSIAAAPQVVWDVLVDMDRWHEWCTVLRAESGALGPSSTPRIRLTPPVGRSYSFTPTVLHFDPPVRLTWVGRTVRRGVFDGEHTFQLSANAAGGTDLVNTETFSGLLSPLFRRTFVDERDVATGFDVLNDELAHRAESIASQPPT